MKRFIFSIKEAKADGKRPASNQNGMISGRRMSHSYSGDTMPGMMASISNVKRIIYYMRRMMFNPEGQTSLKRGIIYYRRKPMFNPEGQTSVRNSITSYINMLMFNPEGQTSLKRGIIYYRRRPMFNPEGQTSVRRKTTACRSILMLAAALTMALWLSPGMARAERYTVDGRSELPLADPCVLYENGIYYAYGTHAANGIEVYLSEDLKTWTCGGLALSKANTSETRWFWAPEVHHIGSTYYMYYSANEHLYCATAASPTGPFRQVSGPFLAEGSIDGTLFRDDDGTYYYFFVRFNDGNNIWVARMTDDLTAIRKETLRHCISADQAWETDPAWPGWRVNEGPYVLKKNGIYYLTYSANHYMSNNYGIGLATAASIDGPWTKAPCNPIFQHAAGLPGVGHHAFFKDKRGHWQMMFHAHNSATEVSPRLSYIVPFKLCKGKGRIRRFRFGRHIVAPKLQQGTSAVR